MTESHSTTCAETGRTFSTAEQARASEKRFLELQHECDAGRVPELRKGDAIYVDTELYVHHGRDDFRGGLAEVISTRSGIGGRPSAFGTGRLQAWLANRRKFKAAHEIPFVCVAQEPDTWHNWQILAAVQNKLRAEFGKSWSHPDPDYRREFNDD